MGTGVLVGNGVGLFLHPNNRAIRRNSVANSDLRFIMSLSQFIDGRFEPSNHG